MNRRSFVAAISAFAAACAGPQLALASNGSAGTLEIPADVDAQQNLTGLERALNEGLERMGMRCRVTLRWLDGKVAGYVRSTIDTSDTAFLVIPMSAYQVNAQVIRQIRYQTMKSVEAIDFTRRTGFAMEFDGPDGRIQYRHVATGRVQFESPE